MNKTLAVFAVALTVVTGLYAQAAPDALIQAIRQNNVPALTALLEKGGDVNSRDARGNTLLVYAAGFGTAEAVELLLARGADVLAKNQFDATALLWGAANPRKARLLIEHGADVNAASKSGRTPLMIAATCDGCVETVRLLLSKGAAVNARDQRGATALSTALQADDPETVRLLIEHGADPVAPDLAGSTPLTEAATNCNLPVLKMLLAKGADVNATTTFGGQVKFGKIQLIHLSPLMLAAPECSAELIQTLLDAGAKVNEKDSRDMTPLMFAVASERQNLAVVRALLKSGAALNVKSNVGETALDWARKFGDPRVIAALTAAGARAGDPFAPPQWKPGAPRTPSQAAGAALTLLQSSSTEFFKQSGCIGCHHQPVAVMAFSSARASGLPLNMAASAEQVNTIRQRETRQQEPMLERIGPGGQTDSVAYPLLALGMAKAPPTDGEAANAVYIAGAQHRDGAWRLNGVSRAPIEDSVIGRTVVALRTLQLYAPPAQKAEMDVRIARGREFLLNAKAATNDDFAMQALGLRWTGAESAQVEAVGQSLIARQRPDGGWAQNIHLASDAYATGETLWALREAGLLSTASPAYQRGVQYLLKTQWTDGSWYVRSRAVKFQPYFQSGFPYDHDQWISAAATAYAVMALAGAGDAPELKTAQQR